MPNYCNNQATFVSDNPAIIKKIVNAANQEAVFDTFVPVEVSDNPISIWGCKWEASDIVVLAQDIHSVTLYFDTPWNPPIEFYQALEEQGIAVRAYYWEPGMAFCGRFDDGVDEEFPATEGEIPADIDAVFNINAQYEEWRVECMEDVERFIYEGQQTRQLEAEIG